MILILRAAIAAVLISFSFTAQAGECEARLLPALALGFTRADTPGFIRQTVANEREQSYQVIRKILKRKKSARTFDNVVLAFEQAHNELSHQTSAADFVSNLLPLSPELLSEYGEAMSDAMALYGGMKSHRPLFAAIRDQRPRNANEDTLQQLILRAFIETEFSRAERLASRRIEQRLHQLGDSFLRNSQGHKPLLLNEYFDELPNDTDYYLDAEQRPYIDLNSKAVYEILSQSPSEEFRRYIYLHSKSHAPSNAGLFAEATRLFAEKAKIHRKANWAELAIEEDSLAESPVKVRKLLEELVGKLKVAAHKRVERLRELKELWEPGHPLQIWDLFYYDNLYKTLDLIKEVEVSEYERYFPARHIIPRALKVIGKVYGLEFTAQPEAPKWADDVYVYQVRETRNGRILGLFYIDAKRKPHKIQGDYVSHQISRTSVNDAVLAMVLNLDFDGDLNRRNLSTLFHELGHAVHGLFAEGESLLWGARRPMDFMEIPSRLTEELLSIPEVWRELSGLGDDENRKLPWKMAKALASRRDEFSFTDSKYMLHGMLIPLPLLAQLDLEIFSQPQGFLSDESIDDIYRRSYADFLGLSLDPQDRIAQVFRNPFHGYAGIFHAYTLADLANADIMEVFKKEGGFNNPAAVDRLKDQLLRPSRTITSHQALENYLGHPLSAKPYLKALNFGVRDN